MNSFLILLPPRCLETLLLFKLKVVGGGGVNNLPKAIERESSLKWDLFQVIKLVARVN